MKRLYLILLVCLPWTMGFAVETSVIDTLRWMARIDSVEHVALHYHEQEYHAIRLARKNADIKQNYFGVRSAEYLQALLHLSELYSTRMMLLTAARYHRLAYEPYMEKLRTEFCHLSESDRAIYWQTASTYFDKTMLVAFNTIRSHRFSDGNAMAAAAYNAQLLSKGLLLNLSVDYERFIMASGCQEAELLLQIRKQESQLGHQQKVDSLDYCILAALDKAGSPYHIDNLAVTWQAVRDGLQSNDLAIEFFQLPDGRFGALLLKHSWRQPKIIRIEKTDNPWPDVLLQYFPNPGKGTVYFSAAGILLQTGIETMPLENIVMSDAFDMVRLSSTRELAMKKQAPKLQTATIYGGIQYNADATTMQMESKHYPDLAQQQSRSLAEDTLNRGFVRYLPGTMKEAENLKRLLDLSDVSATLYKATAANEESFKALSGQHRNVLHIGTHGFSWTDTEAQRKEYFTQHGISSGTIDPLSRCGLLFAGANTALSGHSKELPEGVQDGILTAKEISLMDLRDCDLVVLSACETAKGDITNEGVFGLQRAFKMAGVQTIIMSLWPVNDAATQMLMTEFYTNWIERGQSKREAFKNAQNTVRYAVDKEGHRKYENPVYWAGFVMLD